MPTEVRKYVPLHFKKPLLVTGIVLTRALIIVSSPEPSGSQGELIVYPWSGVRCPSASVVVRPHFSNIFSSETAWPIKAKFYVEPPWGGGTKFYINDPGHMTKMAAMLKNAQNLKKSSSPEPAGRFSRNLVCSIGDSGPS